MNGHQLRQIIGREEFDYQILMQALEKYKAPRQKINELVKSKDIIRVKKGLYVFGEDCSRIPYSKELLGNLIYGPSYISLESALSFYNLIPERVEGITSVTSKKNKEFKTPMGYFSYRYLNLKKYPLGVLRKEMAPRLNILIASPEKAFIDYISLELKTKNHSLLSMEKVISDMRLDEREFLNRINRKRLENIICHYDSNKIIKNMINYFIKH